MEAFLFVLSGETTGSPLSGAVQCGFQGCPQPIHDGGQGFGGEFVLLDECLPQRLPRRIVRELVGEADRQFGGNGHAATFEGGLDRLGQQVGIEGFAFQQHRQVEVVLHAAVRHAQQRDGVEFFGDDGVGRIGPKPGCWQVVQQYRIDRIHGTRRDGIAEADIDLRLAARPGQFARDDHAHTRATAR